MGKEEEVELEDYKVTFMMLLKADDSNKALEKARDMVGNGWESEIVIEHL